jgi:uncharacterized membrane protein YfcA
MVFANPMKYLLICTTALLASAIALLSGFGLGTVLMPVFAIFFPLPLAISATAVVHLASNTFKLFLVGKWASKRAVIRFGIPAALASAFGAYLLSLFSHFSPLVTYQLFGHPFHMTLLGLIVGSIVILSAFLELVPFTFSSSSKTQIFGGFLSGFFGGLTGNQGPFRSAFLLKSGLTKEQFVGTGVVVSIMVDIARLLIYGWAIYWKGLAGALTKEMEFILLAATLAAFAGSYLGAKILPIFTFKALQIFVALLLFVLGFAILVGLV